MMKILITTMKTSISDIMETMFYLPVEFGDALSFRQTGMNNEKASLSSRLKFSGDLSGYFILVIPRDLLAVMAENFMGESSKDLTEEHLSGTLTETLNMIGGNTLSTLDSKIPFELDIPEVIDTSKIPGDSLFTMIETPLSKMAIHATMDA
jgi:CheY-specific phosphatase CheX